MDKPEKEPSRRKFLRWSMGSAVVAAGAITMVRTTGYPKLTNWNGKVLSSRQAFIIMSACEAIIPMVKTPEERMTIAENVDRYLYTFPKELMSQVDLVFEVIEHLTLIDFNYKRFTRLSEAEKNSYLHQLKEMGGDLQLVYRTLRDLCMVGYYQQEAAWSIINYNGPSIGKSDRFRHPKYSGLVAPVGQLPNALINARSR